MSVPEIQLVPDHDVADELVGSFLRNSAGRDLPINCRREVLAGLVAGPVEKESGSADGRSAWCRIARRSLT